MASPTLALVLSRFALSFGSLPSLSWYTGIRRVELLTLLGENFLADALVL